MPPGRPVLPKTEKVKPGAKRRAAKAAKAKAKGAAKAKNAPKAPKRKAEQKNKDDES